jgi:hypothetical protein
MAVFALQSCYSHSGWHRLDPRSPVARGCLTQLRTEFPALEYCICIGRLFRALVSRVAALAFALCLLLPLAQPYQDYQGNSKYLVSQSDVDSDEADRFDPPVAQAVLKLRPPLPEGSTPLVVFASNDIAPSSSAFARPPVRGPPLQYS